MSKHKEDNVHKFRRKDASMWKIDGKAFDELKVLTDEFDKLKAEAEKNIQKCHDAIWERVYKEIGKRKDSLCIDNSYKEMGFIIVKKTDNAQSLIDLLKR